jgi:Protein of unknown function (DUF998)
VCVTDPVGSGPTTLSGTLRGGAGLVCFTSLPAAAVVMARYFSRTSRGWSMYSMSVAVAMLVRFVGSMVSGVLNEQGVLPEAPTGVLQRISIITGWTWIALLGLRVRSASARASARVSS